jgi:hypothetical protein
VLISSALIFLGFKKRPKSWIRIIRMAGNANVVKNAVAAAIRIGSFAFSSTKERRMSLNKIPIRPKVRGGE